MKRFHIDHKNARKIMWVFCGASFPFLLLGVIGSQTMILTAIGVALIVAGGVIGLLFWRCPHCGMHLHSQDGNIQYCPHCGGKL